MKSIEEYCDISDFFHASLFKGVAFVWDVLPNLSGYIENWLENPAFKGTVDREKKIFIGEGTKIDEGVFIKGPTIIGRNCTLVHGSLLRENCILGDRVHIGHAVEVKNSLFFNDSIAAHLNYVPDSIIGNQVNISGGAMIANLRLDKKIIEVKDGDTKISTGLQKFGALVGDNTMIGVNAVLNPGTILGKNTVVYPLQSVRGIHPHGAIIK